MKKETLNNSCELKALKRNAKKNVILIQMATAINSEKKLDACHQKPWRHIPIPSVPLQHGNKTKRTGTSEKIVVTSITDVEGPLPVFGTFARPEGFSFVKGLVSNNPTSQGEKRFLLKLASAAASPSSLC